MEERAEMMTDYQWDNIIKMIVMIAGKCDTVADVLDNLRLLAKKPEEIEKIIQLVIEQRTKKQKPEV